MRPPAPETEGRVGRDRPKNIVKRSRLESPFGHYPHYASCTA